MKKIIITLHKISENQVETCNVRNFFCLIFVVTLLNLFLVVSTISAQPPAELFPHPMVPAPAGAYGLSAIEGEIDLRGLSQGPPSLRIQLEEDYSVVLERDGLERRGLGNLTWRGRVSGMPDSRAVLTLKHGLMAGRVVIGDELYEIRPSRGRSHIIEQLDPGAFPECGGGLHPPGLPLDEGLPAGDPAEEASYYVTVEGDVAEGDPAYDIHVMAVYTDDARAAAGGTSQIEAQIQSAVDSANTAFTDSNMIARFTLVHTAEVVYTETGDMQTDLPWVRTDSTVAALRNQYGADMVSFITEYGGDYCGIGYVQRSPGSGFQSWAFQVTDRGCLSNLSWAHEHGHNMGMEHNPENSSATPATASYPYSFAHYVSGSFRTVMSYYNPCSPYCPRLGQFSNPDILYNGYDTGIEGDRDNAQTGDNTAPVVANFRPAVNNPPEFTNDPIVESDATEDSAYSGTIADDATDDDPGDTLAFSIVSGSLWLEVASDGTLSGTPTDSNVGLNSWTVLVDDGNGGTDQATLQITVINTTAYYCDIDIDGHISDTITDTCMGNACVPAGCDTYPGDDCDDTDSNINPATNWYKDTDGDGFGTSTVSYQQCLQPIGPPDYVLNNADYDDNDSNIYPGGPPVRIAGASYYSVIQEAYVSAGNGETIQILDATLTEDLTIDRNISVVLEGGFDGAFSTISGYTTLNGNINITDGTLTIENFILQ